MDIRGLPQLRRRLDNIQNGRAILAKLQSDTTREAKKLAPYKTRNLSRSIRPGYLSRSEALVKAGANYAAYVEYGTKPHVIRPRKGKSLRFPAGGVGTTAGGRVRTGELRRLGTGAYVFAGEVHHPGTKPQPFLLPGAKKAATDNGMKDIVIELWNKGA